MADKGSRVRNSRIAMLKETEISRHNSQLNFFMLDTVVSNHKAEQQLIITLDEPAYMGEIGQKVGLLGC